MDIRNLSFPGGLFDLIVDKSTIDALLCGDSAYMNVAKMLKVNLLIKEIAANLFQKKKLSKKKLQKKIKFSLI